MYSHDDIKSVFEFLKHTPEKNLRQMLVNKSFTDTHFRLLLKLARTQQSEKFLECFEGEKMPTMKFSEAEITIRENFWPACKNSLAAVGLLGPSTPSTQKAAA